MRIRRILGSAAVSLALGAALPQVAGAYDGGDSAPFGPVDSCEVFFENENYRSYQQCLDFVLYGWWIDTDFGLDETPEDPVAIEIDADSLTQRSGPRN